jgi:hypothetical protein
VNTIKSQIGRHSVALISLLVALSSLAYNTWRSALRGSNYCSSSVSSIALFFIVITTTTRTVAIRVPVGRMR